MNIPISEAIDMIEDVPGFDDESTGVGNAWKSVCNYIKFLEEESKWLAALESAGVDNWQGIDFAKEIFEEES